MTDEPEIDPARFAQWLRNRRGDDVVGIPRKESDCPLARWTREDLGWRHPSVGIADIGSVEKRLPLPDCLQRFVDKVDHSGRRCITAEEALVILESAL